MLFIVDEDSAFGATLLVLLFVAMIIVSYRLYTGKRWNGSKKRLRITPETLQILPPHRNEPLETITISELQQIGVQSDYRLAGPPSFKLKDSLRHKYRYNFIEWTFKDGETRRVNLAIDSDYQTHQIDKIIREWKRHETVPLKIYDEVATDQLF